MFAPKVSIIIPVYNGEAYLCQCLDSVINQTLREIEIIIIDDGSTDSAGSICDKYAEKDERIKVIHKENEGSGIARNLAIKLAQGEYIGFVDSDDWIDLNYYEKLYNAANSNNADISIGGIKRFRGGKIDEWIFIKKTGVIKEFKNQIIKFKYFDGAWDKIYRRNIVIDNHLEFAAKIINEDLAFSIQAAFYADKVVSCPDTFYFYRQNRSSVCYNRGNKIFDIFIAFDLCQTFVNSIEDSHLHRSYQNLLDTKKSEQFFIQVFQADKCDKQVFYDKVKEIIKDIDFKANEHASIIDKARLFVLKHARTPKEHEFFGFFIRVIIKFGEWFGYCP